MLFPVRSAGQLAVSREECVLVCCFREERGLVGCFPWGVRVRWLFPVRSSGQLAVSREKLESVGCFSWRAWVSWLLPVRSWVSWLFLVRSSGLLAVSREELGLVGWFPWGARVSWLYQMNVLGDRAANRLEAIQSTIARYISSWCLIRHRRDAIQLSPAATLGNISGYRESRLLISITCVKLIWLV